MEPKSREILIAEDYKEVGETGFFVSEEYPETSYWIGVTNRDPDDYAPDITEEHWQESLKEAYALVIQEIRGRELQLEDIHCRAISHRREGSVYVLETVRRI